MVGRQKNSELTFPEQPQLFSLAACQLQQGRSVLGALILTLSLVICASRCKALLGGKTFSSDIQITGMEVTNILRDKHNLHSLSFNFELGLCGMVF